MSLTTITAAKELEESYQQILLVTISFADGTISRYATHPLNVAEGGVQYNGHDYLGRVMQQDLKAVQAMDSLGLDRIPQAAIHLADADAFIWQSDEINTSRGHKGATMSLDLIDYDIDAGTFSSDSDNKFSGPIKTANRDANGVLTLLATAQGNTQQGQLPPVRRQPRCSWIQPLDATSQADSVFDDSPFHECGFNPALGRGISGSPPCDYTKPSCILTGMYAIGAFSGNTFTPPLYWRSLGYVAQKITQGTNSINDAGWGAPYPMPYGTTWVEPVIWNVIGDGNSTRLQAVLCAAQLSTSGFTTDPGSILKVIVADTEIPFVAYSPDKKLFRWQWVNNGSRDGQPSSDAGYVDASGTPISDPGGSLSIIEICFPIDLAASSSPPKVEVLLRAPVIPKYAKITSVTFTGGVGVATLAATNTDIASNDPNYTISIKGNAYGAANAHFVGLTSWTSTTVTFNASGVPNGTGAGGYLRYKVETDNPVWALMDAGEWSGIRIPVQALDSWIATAAIAEPAISFQNASGATVTTDADGTPHKRFRISACINKLTAQADVLAGLRNSFGGYLDYVNGAPQLRIKGPLAEQQSAPIAGSNYNTAVSSTLRDGTSASGYVAYSFGPSSIKRDSSGNTTLRVSFEQDPPNRLQFAFQDKDNGYQQDSINEVDSAAVSLIGAEYAQNVPIIGPNTFDHGMRIAAQKLAELHRGNPSGKPTGTHIYDWETSQKGEHLRAGQIVFLNDVQLGLTNQLVRIAQIQTGTNCEDIAITALWHSDTWYEDVYGQPAGLSLIGNSGRDGSARPPYPWGPGQIAPFSSDPFYTANDDTFDIETNFDEVVRDGTVRAEILLYGGIPIDSFGAAQPPSLVPQATLTGTSGPFVGPASYFIAVSAQDANGKYSALSQFARVDVPSGSATSITASIPVWGVGTTGYAVYVSKDSRRFSLHATASGTPSTITVSTYKPSYLGPPDQRLATMRVRNKKVIVPGVFTGEVSVVTSTTIKVAGATWTTNQWVGRVVTDYSVPYVANYAITANTADTLTVTGNPAASPGISRPYSKQSAYTQAVNVGDIIVIRAKVSVSGNVLTDASWALDTTGNGVVGNYVRIIAGTGRGKTSKITTNTATTVTTEPFSVTLDATSVPIIEAPNWLYVADHDPFLNSDIAAGIGLICPVDNFDGHAVGVQVFTVAADGTESLADISPFRDLWIGGADGTTGGAAAPGPILGLVQVGSTDLTTDPAFALVTVQYSQPTSLNGFDSTQWYITYAGYTTPVTGPLTNFLGTSPQTDVLRIPRPTAAGWTSPVLWGTSSSATYFNPLVVAAGPTQTPHISLATITTFTGATSPVATLPSSTATALIVISSAATGATRWGMKVTVTAPAGGWAANNVYYLKGQAKQIGGAGVVSFLWKSFSIPSGSTSFVAEADVSFWRPAYSPTGAFDESWEAEVTASNIEDIPGAVITSAPVPVVGGGDATPAPNPTSITNTFDYDDEGGFFANTVWTFPTTTYQFVNYFIPTLYAYQPPPGGTTIVNSPVGNMGRFDFFDFGIPARFNPSTGAFSWRHGPYERNTVAQDYAVTALCFSGIGVDTASPIVSAPFTIQPVPTNHSDTSMIVSVLAVTRNSPVLRDVDGSPQMAFTASFTNPSNTTDAYAIRPTVRNTLDSNDVERVTGNDFIIGDNGGPGATSRKIGFGPWTEYIGTYRFTFYTINSHLDKIGGAAPFIDVVISTATAGAIALGRGAASSLTSVQMVSGIIDSLRLVANAGLTIFKTVAGLPTLPDVNYPPGCTVLEVASKKLWFNVGGSWVVNNPSDVLTGLLGDPDILTGSLNFNKINNSTIAIVDSNIAANIISFSKIKSSTVVIADSMLVVGSLNFNKLNNTTVTITDSNLTVGTINFNKINNSTITINAGTVTLVGQWADGTLAGINASKLIAGTITATIGITVATIAGSGGAFSITMDTTNGIKLTSNTNSSTVTLQPGWVAVSGTSGLVGYQAELQPTNMFISLGSTAASMGIIGSGSGCQVKVASSNGTMTMSSDTSFGANLNSSSTGANIRFSGTGSFITVRAGYQINGITIIDSGGLLNAPDAGAATIAGVLYSHSFFVKLGAGTFRVGAG